MQRTVDVVRRWLAPPARVTVLTGAGVSTDSGIPDYRGPDGVWTRDPSAARLSSLADYLADPDLRRRSWQARRAHPAWTASPNAAHHALVAFEHSGRLAALLTQNVDGLHQKAGSSPARVLELHGSIHTATCLTCGERTPMSEVLRRVDEEPDPHCLRCGGLLKSATVSFGEALDPRVLTAAVDAACSCDVFLAVGTSLSVQPAASLCTVARDRGARFVVVNAQPTPYDEVADAVLREPIGWVLPRLLGGEAGVAEAG